MMLRITENKGAGVDHGDGPEKRKQLDPLTGEINGTDSGADDGALRGELEIEQMEQRLSPTPHGMRDRLV